MDTYIYGVILMALILLLSYLVRGRINSKKIENESFDDVLILHRSIFISGLLGFVFFAAVTVAVIIEKESQIYALPSSALCFLGLLLIVAWSNCRIYYNSEMFTVKYLSGKMKSFAFSDVTDLTGTGSIRGDIKIYAGKRIAAVDSSHEGNERFVKLVRRKYKELHDGKTLHITSRKKGGFSSHVGNAGSWILFYVLIICASLLPVIIVSCGALKPAPDDMIYHEIAFDSYEEYKKELRLYVNGDSKFYQIPDYEKLMQNDIDFFALCEQHESFIISYIEFANSAQPHYRVMTIEHMNGTVFLTWEASNHYRYAIDDMLLLSGIALISITVFIIISVYIGGHPEKFSEKTKRAFFGKNHHVR